MADPFDAFKNSVNDPFAAFMETGSSGFDAFEDPYRVRRGGRTIIDPNYQLKHMESLLSRSKVEKPLALEVLQNAGKNVKDILYGLTKLGGLGIYGAKQLARVPFNAVTGDTDDLSEIMGTFKNAASAVPEIAVSEWERIKSVYGPIVSDFDFNPLMK